MASLRHGETYPCRQFRESRACVAERYLATLHLSDLIECDIPPAFDCCLRTCEIILQMNKIDQLPTQILSQNVTKDFMSVCRSVTNA